ncbi:hypothetical protein MUK42_28666 [Musa troglodytarum]|uniref:Uncharacterized protein n=1 Tax=Musa troglodytarum TaxID=320322 RepID=A0A9E7K6P4_9LILI|nr:hypothetical protein MUK42_28666 [Musa troglodytarum]
MCVYIHTKRGLAVIPLFFLFSNSGPFLDAVPFLEGGPNKPSRAFYRMRRCLLRLGSQVIRLLPLAMGNFSRSASNPWVY